MSPILHAMFIKPLGTEFTRTKGKVYSWVCDRDNMLFDANGNMIIDSDGLPKIIGVPKEPLPKQRKKSAITKTDRKSACKEAIISQLQNGKMMTCTELHDVTGYSRCTVAKYLDTLKSEGIIITSKITVWRKQVEYFRLARGYLEVSA